MTDIREARRSLVTRIVEGGGRASIERRRAAFANAGLDGALDPLVRKTVEHAYLVSDEDVAAARAAGFDEDELFELMVCAAVGEAGRQLDTALAALDEASVER